MELSACYIVLCEWTDVYSIGDLEIYQKVRL